MAIDCEVRGIVGKTISGIVIKEGDSPTTQLFLLFDDGTYYEFYSLGGPIATSSGLIPGGRKEVHSYCASSHRCIFEA